MNEYKYLTFYIDNKHHYSSEWVLSNVSISWNLDESYFKNFFCNPYKFIFP